jgi:hypothetical protein
MTITERADLRAKMRAALRQWYIDRDSEKLIAICSLKNMLNVWQVGA